jgi:hypothetical protein
MLIANIQSVVMPGLNVDDRDALILTVACEGDLMAAN